MLVTRWLRMSSKRLLGGDTEHLNLSRSDKHKEFTALAKQFNVPASTDLNPAQNLWGYCNESKFKSHLRLQGFGFLLLPLMETQYKVL